MLFILYAKVLLKDVKSSSLLPDLWQATSEVFAMVIVPVVPT